MGVRSKSVISSVPDAHLGAFRPGKQPSIHSYAPGTMLFFEYSVVHRVRSTPSNALAPLTTSPIPPSHPRIQDPPKWGLFTAPAKAHPGPAELSQNDSSPVGSASGLKHMLITDIKIPPLPNFRLKRLIIVLTGDTFREYDV